MKKLIALLLALVMVFALVACGEQTPGSSEPNGPAVSDPVDTPSDSVVAVTYENYAFDRSWPEETLKIGVELFNPTDDTWLGVKAYFDYLASIFNIEYIYSEAITSAEQEFAFIDSCAAAGCKGIYAYYNASGPSAIMNATSQGMFYVGIADYYDRFVDDEYYVGGYTFASENGLSGDYTAGYELGYSLAMQDVEHIVYASGETKVAMFKDRAQGFYDGVAAAQADGSTARFDPEVDVIGGWPDAPTFPALQTAALTADYDAVGSANDIAYWLQPVSDAGKQMKMACIGTVSASYKSYVDNGTISVIVYDAPEYVHGAPMIMLINACTGYGELTKNADGTPRLQSIHRWTVDSPELFNEIFSKHSAGEFYVGGKDVAMLLGGLNPNASLDLMDAIYDVPMDEVMGK